MDPSATYPWLAVSPLTKTYLSVGLVVIAVFEYLSAMHVFGKRGPKAWAKQTMQLHRAMGYVFMAYFVWITWICLDMMERLSAAGGYDLDARAVGHGALAITLMVIWLVKVSFVRFYPEFRPYAKLLGILLSTGTLVLWGVAGWMFLWLIAGVQPVTP